MVGRWNFLFGRPISRGKLLLVSGSRVHFGKYTQPTRGSGIDSPPRASNIFVSLSSVLPDHHSDPTTEPWNPKAQTPSMVGQVALFAKSWHVYPATFFNPSVATAAMKTSCRTPKRQHASVLLGNGASGWFHVLRNQRLYIYISMWGCYGIISPKFPICLEKKLSILNCCQRIQLVVRVHLYNVQLVVRGGDLIDLWCRIHRHRCLHHIVRPKSLRYTCCKTNEAYHDQTSRFQIIIQMSINCDLPRWKATNQQKTNPSNMGWRRLNFITDKCTSNLAWARSCQI